MNKYYVNVYRMVKDVVTDKGALFEIGRLASSKSNRLTLGDGYRHVVRDQIIHLPNTKHGSIADPRKFVDIVDGN